MGKEPKKLPAAFWQSDTGAEPVREWLKDLSKADRFEIGTAIKTVEYGWPVGMPVCEYLEKGIWQVRVDLPQRRIARVLFCTRAGFMVLLHGFIKKTQKTPHEDLVLALKRKRSL